MSIYIHQLPDWPNFTWRIEEFVYLLGEARNLQGRLMGKMESLGFDLRSEALLETLTLDVLKSTEIEGEILDPAQVRSSVARRLGMEIAGSVESDRNVDGMVDMMMDATKNCRDPLTSERLFPGMRHYSQQEEAVCIKLRLPIGGRMSQVLCR
jgi:Fic family protein